MLNTMQVSPLSTSQRLRSPAPVGEDAPLVALALAGWPAPAIGACFGLSAGAVERALQGARQEGRAA